MTEDFFTLHKLKQMSSLGRPLDAKTSPVTKDLKKGKKRRAEKDSKNNLPPDEQEKEEKKDLGRGKILDILV